MYQNNFGDTTLKNKIDEISAAVEELERGYGNDEKLFELGIELGKYLSATGISFDRLPFFIEREIKRNTQERIRDKIQKIGNLIHRLFYISCGKQLEKSGVITFDSSTYWRGSSNIIDSEISQELFVKCNSIAQENEESDFEVEIEVVGEIANIFEKYQAEKNMTISLYNRYASSSRTFDNAKDIKSALGDIWIEFDRTSHNLNEQQLDEMFEEIHASTIFLSIKYSAE